MKEDEVPSYIRAKVLILGCGNVLFGDDGFGPEVANALLDKDLQFSANNNGNNHQSQVVVMNVGTSVRKILFNITLSEIKPHKIWIVDAVDKGREPGEIFEISVDDMPEIKIDDFSLHQLPTSNLLKELKDLCKVDITVLACQVEYIPEVIEPGLSPTLQASLPKMVELIINKIQEEVG
ncbi:MAG: hydrogenase maturation protease [Thermoplasmata archaeon]|nr:hydrogenase maturation protease [Thermoplasmata archaeon]